MKHKPFTRLIRQYRLERDWTQADAARRARLPFYRYQQIETVTGRVATAEELGAIAKAFKADVTALRQAVDSRSPR